MSHTYTDTAVDGVVDYVAISVMSRSLSDFMVLLDVLLKLVLVIAGDNSG